MQDFDVSSETPLSVSWQRRSGKHMSNHVIKINQSDGFGQNKLKTVTLQNILI
jgi:hypothetical protein